MQPLDGIIKKSIHNEKGIALISALMFSMIGMLMVASLLLMVTNGTWISGSKKRYHMDLNAAYGGMNFFTKEILQRGIGGTGLSAMGNYGGLLTPVISNGNFNTKLTTTGKIGDGAFPNDLLDLTLKLTVPTGPTINVNSTIISTSRGNSGTSSNNLLTGGVVNNNSGTITPQHIPYLYQTLTVGQDAGNTKENANLSAVYLY